MASVQVHSSPSSVSSTPGCESAARSLRTTVSVESGASRSGARSDRGTAGPARCPAGPGVGTRGEALHGEQDGRECRVGDLVAVQIALGHRGKRTRDGRPHVTGVHLLHRLQDRHAPALRALLGPSRRTAPGPPPGPVDHEARIRLPQLAGIAVLSIGARTSCGACRRTASANEPSGRASSTVTRWPRSRSSAWTRWVRLLNALATSRMCTTDPRRTCGERRCGRGGPAECDGVAHRAPFAERLRVHPKAGFEAPLGPEAPCE